MRRRPRALIYLRRHFREGPRGGTRFRDPRTSEQIMSMKTRSGQQEAEVERIYYDGDCGVCHWAVRFVGRHDATGTTFRFAPLGGQVFDERLTLRQRRSLPDSLVVQRANGDLLLQSDGVIHILRRLGGRWRLLGHLLALVPRPLRNFGYARFAAVRDRLATKPEGSCPMPSPELRSRLDP